MAQTFLITGATSGIGLALARQFHQDSAGYRLVLVGRRSRLELDDSLFTDTNYCQADLAAPDAAERVDAWCEKHGIETVDVAINNAGVGWTGPLWEQPADSICDLVNVNLIAPIAVTQALLPRVQRVSGTMVYISSVMSTVASPDMAVYSATKKALDGFVRSLRAEHSTGGVRFQVVHPGATNTAMPGKVGIPASESNKWPSAESVAADIIEGLDSGARHRAIGRSNKVLRSVSRRLPRLVAAAAGRRNRSPLTLLAAGSVPRVLITGAADGIGRALAVRYAEDGYQVLGVDIDVDRANQTAALAADGRIQFRILDLATSDMGWVVGLEPFDVIVHNAGTSAVGPFASIEAEAYRQVVAINLLAPMLLTRELLATNKINDGARIVLLSSLSHQLGYPGAAVYAATKDGLEMYGRALAVAIPDVSVTTVFPGPTRTAHAARYSPDNSNESRRMDPADLADAIVDTRRARLVPGSAAKGLSLIHI